MTVVVAGYARTPFTKFTGQLATESSSKLGAHAITAALARAGVKPAEVQRIFAGQGILGGAGQNPARQAAVGAGIPLTVPAMTINIVCLSRHRRYHRRRAIDEQQPGASLGHPALTSHREFWARGR